MDEQKTFAIFNYLQSMADMKASDLYLTVGYPPSVRLEGDMRQLSDVSLGFDDMDDILSSILTVRQRREFETSLELNTALEIEQLGRFRVNVMRQRQMPAIVIRRIISSIPNFEELKLPNVLEGLSLQKRGLILLTGTAGSGKSTTLASMVDYRNANMKGHIITIEDPIEYYHEHKQSVITQREVGVDTESYAHALKNTLRQRPDVILIGEIRDREVMEQTLMIAETGHLCLATIHTNNAYQAIERIVNMFPKDLASQIRLNLSLNLQAIVSQRLLPTVEDGALAPAVEIMLNQALIKELIAKGEIAKIREVIEQNETQGMCSFDQSILKLYQKGLITEETALTFADKATDLKIKIHQKNIEKTEISGGKSLGDVDTSSFVIRD